MLLPERKLKEMLKVIKENPQISVWALAKQCKVSASTAWKYLRLYRSGKLEGMLEGERKGAKQGPGSLALRVRTDEEFIDWLMRVREDPKAPIIFKQVRDAAWYLNTTFETDKYLLYHVVPNAGIAFDEAEIEDYSLAAKKLISFIEACLQAREDAKKLAEAQAEKEMYECLLFNADDMCTKYKLLAEAYRFSFDILAKHMCLKCKQRALNEMIIAGALKVSPKVLMKS